MPAEFSINPSQIGATMRGIVSDVVKQERAALVYACRAAAVDAVTEVVCVIDSLKFSADGGAGGLKGSFRATPTPDGATLYSSAPHAAFVEFGTRPHWAPINPLIAWATNVLKAGNAWGQVKAMKRPSKTRADAALTLARTAQAGIAKRGTRGRHYFEMAAAKFPTILQRRLAEAQARVK